jgi:hypothetical protein
MRFEMTYAAAVSDPRIVDESMTSELFSGLEGSNVENETTTSIPLT